MSEQKFVALAAATDFEVKQIQRTVNRVISRDAAQITSQVKVIAVGVSCRNLSDACFDTSACSAIVSVGFAGALNPALQPGMCLLPRSIVTDKTSYEVDPDLHQMISTAVQPDNQSAAMLHTERLLATVTDKQFAFERSQCDACDMESGILAEQAWRLDIPFACVRVVLDPASAAVPLCISNYAQPGWSNADFVLANLRRPQELPATVAIIKHSLTATKSLKQATTMMVERLIS